MGHQGPRQPAIRSSDTVHESFSPDLFPVLFDAAPFGAALVDPPGRLIRSNPALQQILGRSADELASLNFVDVTHPDDVELDAELFRQLMRGERNHYTLEKRYLHSDGRTVWGKLAVIRIQGGPDGELIGLATVTDITAQIEVEQNLRREKETLELVAATAPGAFCSFRIAPGGQIVLEAHGPRIEEILGLSRADLAADPGLIGRMIHPDDQRRLREAVLESGRTLRSWRDETRIAHPTAGERWIESHFQPTRALGGGTVWRGFLIDVTDLRRAEIERRETDRRLATLVLNLPGAAFRCRNDADWTMEYISQGIEPMTGVPPEALIDNRAATFADLIHPDDQEYVWSSIQDAIAEGDHYQIEYRLLHRDGSVRHVLENGLAVHDQDGGMIHLEGYLTDLTSRRRAEAALSESEARLRAREHQYRLLTENTVDVIWTLNLDLEFTFLNQSLLLLTGHSPEEWIGTKLRDHTDEENFRKMVAHVQRAIERGPDSAGVIFEAEMLRRDGSPIPVEVRGRLAVDEQGRPVGLQGTTRDISERRRQQEQQDALREQLLQSQKMEAIGRLAGGVAHDFNNMLTVISNYSDLVLDALPPDAAPRRDVARIRNAADRAAELTQQLLAFSRKQMLRPVPIDVNQAVRRAGDMLRRLIGEDIELELELADEATPVVFDPGQIDQILLNLAVNSRDAMPRGGRLILETRIVTLDAAYLEKHADAGPGRYVMLAVSDSGTGMDPQTRQRVFEPFFTTKAHDGTGLGLSTVYGIVKQHGGAIELYSEEGMGTTVKIYLPRSGEPAGESVPGIDEPVRGGGETILLVEDDPAVRRVTERILLKYGYRVIVTDCGEAAIEAAGNTDQAIDMMVSDVVMPGLDGRATYREIELRRPGLPVLFMSGYTENTMAHHGVLDEGIDFIHKPFALEDLARRVREVLDRAGTT